MNGNDVPKDLEGDTKPTEENKKGAPKVNQIELLGSES
jgi:hypothetical protein